MKSILVLVAMGCGVCLGQGELLVVSKQTLVRVGDLERLVRVGMVDAGREPDGLAWWSGSR